MPKRPTQDPEGPDELGGPAAFARICGHADTQTITHWVRNPPPGFPEPDAWEELPTRRRPLWRRRRMQKFADNRPPARRGGGRPAKPYRFHGDPRLTAARAALREHPDASNAALAQQLADTWAGRPYSASTWCEIVRTARQHPQDDTEEDTRS